MTTLGQVARAVAAKQAARDVERLTAALIDPPGLGQEEAHQAELEWKVCELTGLTLTEWRGLDVFGRRVWLEKAVDALPCEAEAPRTETAADKRNAWLYAECCKGTPYFEIRQRLKTKPKSWERIESDQGIKKAAERYAERFGLPMPASRKPGRPRKRKTKHR